LPRQLVNNNSQEDRMGPFVTLCCRVVTRLAENRYLVAKDVAWRADGAAPRGV